MEHAPFYPVLLGADMNCYGMARNIHEAYGLRSDAFGRWPMGDTKYSKIIQFHENSEIDNDTEILRVLSDFSTKHPDAPKLLVGCTDDYAALLIRNRKALCDMGFTVPYIEESLMDQLVTKDSFYDLCRLHKLPFPKTEVLHPCDIENEHTVEKKLQELPFSYPIVLKPASSIAYWKHSFEGMKKVYFPKDASEALAVARQIFASGYSENLILQEFLPGGDSEMRVLTAYCNQKARVEMMCLGHVLLEEHTPTAIGNHAAIVTEYDRELMDIFAQFLENIGYVGFANFDIKRDRRTGCFKVFEINLRQGRSHFYVTGSGVNLAKLLVDDWILGKEQDGLHYVQTEHYWHSVPNHVVWSYTEDEKMVHKAQSLIQKGEESSTFDYHFDKRLNPLRCLYLIEHARRHKKKFATYCTPWR